MNYALNAETVMLSELPLNKNLFLLWNRAKRIRCGSFGYKIKMNLKKRERMKDSLWSIFSSNNFKQDERRNNNEFLFFEITGWVHETTEHNGRWNAMEEKFRPLSATCAPLVTNCLYVMGLELIRLKCKRLFGFYLMYIVHNMRAVHTALQRQWCRVIQSYWLSVVNSYNAMKEFSLTVL